MYLYLVKITNNYHGDIFIFTNYFSAVEFCKEKTKWSNIEINNKIQKVFRPKDKKFYKFSI